MGIGSRVRTSLGVKTRAGLGLSLDLHFAVWVSVLQSTFRQLLSACGERERVDAIFVLVPLD